MHSWGDEDFDWIGLDNAIDYIHTNLVRWGRINVRQSKEKFGTARIYCSLGFYHLLSITHPGHVSWKGRYPNWLFKLDIHILSPIIEKLNFVVIPYQAWVYKTVYKNAVQKYPHLKKEIICAADYPQLLKGV